jgi:hypothetical protein
MKRTILGFSLRSDAGIPVDEMRACVEQTLGCTLAAGDYHGVSALLGELLGMRILLLPWRGLNWAEVYQLHGMVDDPRYLEAPNGAKVAVTEINLNDAIIDLFAVRKQIEWRAPSFAEVEAEANYADEVDREFNAPESDTESGAPE